MKERIFSHQGFTPLETASLNRSSLTGFTLIELVIVITILAILAAVAIPAYVHLREEAIRAQEEAIIGALKSALGLRRVVNYFECLDSKRAWPGTTDYPFTGNPASPFELLEVSPPVEVVVGPPGNPSADGVTWRAYRNTTGCVIWGLYCPHYCPPSACPGGEGRNWVYFPNDCLPNGSAGEIQTSYDYGH